MASTMSTLATTPSLVFTSPSDESLPNITVPTSTSAEVGELHDVDLRPPPRILPTNVWISSDKELATNAAERRPKSRSTTPQPPLSRVSSLSGAGIYPKEKIKLAENASLEELSKLTGDPSRQGPRSYDGDAVDARRFRSRATRGQREYHRDEPPLPYPDGFSSRSESSASEGIYEKSEGLPRVDPQIISPNTNFLTSRPVSPIRQLKRVFPFLSTRRLRAIPDSPLLWLILYFTLNLSLTLYNKSVLIRFPFPYTLTALHALCGTIGTFILLRLDSNSDGSRSGGGVRLTTTAPTHNQIPDLSGKQLIVLFLFSILYTLNIVVSNASLRLVTVPFHQVVRASTPFFTIMFAAILLGKRCTKDKLLSLIPVVAGVGFATYGDYYFTPFGFFLTLVGTVLASLKTILTNVILVKPSSTGLPVSTEINYAAVDERRSQAPSFPPSFISSVFSLLAKRVFPPSPSQSPAYATKSLPPTSTPISFSLPKLSLSPIHLLYLLSPLAFIQTTLLAHFTGELDRVRWHLFDPATATATYGANAVNGRMWLLLNGVLAFMLNVVSFNANRRVGPLGMSVAANVKQVLTVLSAVIIFDLTITPANGLGIVLTLIGGALYASVELREKREAASLIKTRIG